MSRYIRLLNLFMLKGSAALKAFSVTLMLSLMVGCSSTNPVYHNYTLVAAPASEEGKVHTALPATLGVFPVNVSGWLDKKNITWSDGGVRLKTFDNDHWGEPLPDLLTQSMVQNLRRQVRAQSWVSSGPWVRDKRPEVVAFIDVQSMSVVKHQLRVNVAWSLEGQDSKIIARKEKVYALLLDNSDSVQASVQTLSRVWGMVAKDMIQALPAAPSKAQKTAS
ncbi:membrane integrity-associated transporter subunit PqiC [Endozoicomonas sp.]|uniref:PqiC family protein n=1 Tax=Endozoicomonas sp. TaxID=1892382 RepID=UPI0028842FDB|nr:ABC-type transport auxiliary lipoprotein family protein [Endozoicomonas sp.]